MLDYLMYDADNHLYESRDAFTRHLPSERARDLYWITDERGRQHVVVGGKVWDFIPNPTFDPVAVPGALDRRKVEPLADHPEYQDRDARLATFDRQGIEASLMFPTMASGLEEVVDDDIELHRAILWAYNRWLEEDWGFAYRDRIFATPLITLSDASDAEDMLDWAIGKGCRAIMLGSGPVLTAEGYRSPGDPMFDGFWGRCAEAGVLVCAHISATGYNRYSGDLTGNYKWKPFQDQSLDSLINHGRAISDFFASMTWHGALTRHPELRLVSVENGSDWVPRLLELFRRYASRSDLPEDPVAAFQRGVVVTPHWDDPIGGLVEHIPVEHVTAGSDYPHYDALATPTDFAEHLDGLGPDDVRKVMRDNLRSLLRAA